ncbi:unnamed protein product [Sphagnum troendelagicum]
MQSVGGLRMLAESSTRCHFKIMATIEEGRCVHQQIIQTGLKSNVFVGITLVDMYAKCGSIEDAWRLFNNMPY